MGRKVAGAMRTLVCAMVVASGDCRDISGEFGSIKFWRITGEIEKM